MPRSLVAPPKGGRRISHLSREPGFVYIMDRAKDIIIRGGENISCAEVDMWSRNCGESTLRRPNCRGSDLYVNIAAAGLAQL